MSRGEKRLTVGQLRAALNDLPADLPVQFTPITKAWLGSMTALRAFQIEIYNSAGADCTATDRDAEAHIYLYEEEEDDS